MHTVETLIKTLLSSFCPSGVKARIFFDTPSSLSYPKGAHKKCSPLQCLNELFPSGNLQSWALKVWSLTTVVDH